MDDKLKNLVEKEIALLSGAVEMTAKGEEWSKRKWSSTWDASKCTGVCKTLHLDQ